MAVSLMEAVTALNTTLLGLLPGAADPLLAPELFVNPLRSRPAGVGGVVGIRTAAPAGEVTALHVTAEVVVRVKAPSAAQLAAAESSVTLALLGADPVNLRSNGVFRIRRMAANGDQQVSGSPNVAERDVRFEVFYEFSKLPDAAGGVISSIPLDLLQRTSATAARAPSQLLRVDCEQDPLALFDVVDDDSLSEPGQWQYDAVEREIRQASAAGGGSNNFNTSKRGTYLLVRPGSTPPAPKDFVLYTSMRSDSSGGIGLIFRFQDIDNFYYVLLHDNGNPNAPFRYRIMGRKVGGTFSFLDAGGADDTSGYAPNTWFSLRLAAQDQQFDLAVDGVDVLSGRDSSITSPGRVGLMSRSAAGARFRFLDWVAL
jgi:hypothetical protein